MQRNDKAKLLYFWGINFTAAIPNAENTNQLVSPKDTAISFPPVRASDSRNRTTCRMAVAQHNNPNPARNLFFN